MTSSEKKFIETWGLKRKSWSWASSFKKGALFIAWPLLLLTDLINFFIIGDIRFAFISYSHLWYLGFNLIWTGIAGGFIYGFYDWNSNEYKYHKLLKKLPKE